MEAAIPQVLAAIARNIPPRRKRQLALVLAGAFVLALVELAVVAALAFMAAVIADPTAISAVARLPLPQTLVSRLAALDHAAVIVLVTSGAALMLAVKNSLAAAIAYSSATLGSLIDSHFGELLLADMFARPHIWHLAHNSSELYTLLSWRKHAGSGVVFMAVQTVCDVLVILLLMAGLIFVSPLVTLSLIGAMSAVGALVLGLYRPLSMRVAAHYKTLEAELNRETLQAFQAVKDIKIFHLERFFVRHFREISDRYARSEGLQRTVLRAPSLLFEVLGFMVIFVAIVVMLYANKGSSRAILGTLTLLTVTAWRVLNAVNRILSSVSAIRQDMVPASKALSLIEERRDPGHDESPAPLPFERAIELSGVGFTYPGADRPALRDLNAVIAKGSALGLVGRSGSGKSTLADLIIGLLEPDQGQVKIDGAPLGPDAVGPWLRRVGYVGQTPCILDATLARNIAFGVDEPDIDLDKVKRCCRMAHIDEFLPGLPNGLDTPLGERGASLSGGQRQRVAIARALYRDPDVLVLDEATSALDTKSEQAFLRTVEALSGSVTLVIVAHRLSTVERCDEVLWLGDGRQRAKGPAREVLAAYREEMDT